MMASKDTVATLAVKLSMMQEWMAELKEQGKETNLKLDLWLERIFRKIEHMERDMDNKYAPKRTERAWIWLITGVGGAVLVALMSLVLK